MLGDELAPPYVQEVQMVGMSLLIPLTITMAMAMAKCMVVATTVETLALWRLCTDSSSMLVLAAADSIAVP